MEVKDEYVADTSKYSGPLREAARSADQFGDKNSKAALAARKMGLAASEAADKAARAMSKAGEAAENLAMGLGSAEEKADAEARALRELERAAIKAAEAELAVAKAADEAGDQMRQAARDAELAGAAQKLAFLKASGATKQHNDLLRQLESKFGDLSKEGSKAFQAVEESGTSAFAVIGKSGPVAIAAIAAGIALLPAAVTVAADAVALGFGGALTAIAIKSQLANKQVQAAFAGTASYVSANLKNISEPFHATLLAIAADGRTAFDNIKESLSGAFAEMAPAVTHFGRQFADSLKELNPAISSIGHAFSTVLGTLGNQLPTIMKNFGGAIKSITDAAAANPQALTSLITGMSQVAQVAGTTIATIIRYKDVFDGLFRLVTQQGGAFPKIIQGIKGGSEMFVDFGGQASVAGAQVSALSKDMQTLASAESSAADKANALSDAFNRLLNPAEAVFKDTATLSDSIKAMSKALQESHGRMNDNSTAAKAAKQAFAGVIDNTKTLATDLLNSGKSIDQVRAKLQPYIASLYKAAGSNKQARALVDDFVRSLDGMPANKKVSLSLDAQDFFSALHKAQNTHVDPKTGLIKGNNSDYLNKWLKTNGLRIDTKTGLLKGNNANYYNAWLKANGLKINPKTGVIKGNTAPFWAAVHAIPSTVKTVRVGVYYVPLNSYNEPGTTHHARGGLVHRARGGPVGMANGGDPGGYVRGPGTTTSDSIPVLLSDKEYVINAEQTAKYKPLLDAINYKLDGFAEGGYAKGGKPKKPTKAQLASAAATRARALSRSEELAALAAQHSLALMRSSVLGGVFRGGPAGIGSSGSTIVQHVATVNVTVQGSVAAERDLTLTVQKHLIANGWTVSR